MNLRTFFPGVRCCIHRATVGRAPDEPVQGPRSPVVLFLSLLLDRHSLFSAAVCLLFELPRPPWPTFVLLVRVLCVCTAHCCALCGSNIYCIYTTMYTTYDCITITESYNAV